MARTVAPLLHMEDIIHAFPDEGLARSCEGWYEVRCGGSTLSVLFWE